MASNLTDHQYCDGLRTGSGFGKDRTTVKIESSWGTANLTVNSQQRVWKTKRACFVSNFVLRADDMDTHATTPTLAFDVGTNTDDDEFIANSAVGQAGGWEQTNVVDTSTEQAGFQLAAGEYIIISVKTAAATAAAGTTTLWFDIWDGDPSGDE